MPNLFLSPSTQEYNLYYDGEGNEEYYMNILADLMEPYLSASGISFTRNDPEGSVGASVRKSNSGNYGLHLALHSNASGSANPGGQRGSDFYYFPGSTEGKRAADIFVSLFKNIYPLPERVRAIPTTTLYEVRNAVAPTVLAEIAYHDNPEDAEWIRSNLNVIARTLAQGVAQFFGVPFVQPGITQTATVRTAGGRLNLRSSPSLNGTIIGAIPNGTTVSVTGREGNWYAVIYNGQNGYVSGDYLVING